MSVVKHEWWSTPIWEIDTGFSESFNSKLAEQVLSCEKYPSSIWDNDLSHINIIKSYITEALHKHIDDQLVLNNGWYASWNKDYGHKNIEIHDHGGSFIVCVYYIKVPEKSADLIMVDPRGGVRWYAEDSITTDCSKIRKIQPKEGKLVIFPGYVLHGTDRCDCEEYRICLVSNVDKIARF